MRERFLKAAWEAADHWYDEQLRAHHPGLPEPIYERIGLGFEPYMALHRRQGSEGMILDAPWFEMSHTANLGDPPRADSPEFLAWFKFEERRALARLSEDEPWQVIYESPDLGIFGGTEPPPER